MVGRETKLAQVQGRPATSLEPLPTSSGLSDSGLSMASPSGHSGTWVPSGPGSHTIGRETFLMSASAAAQLTLNASRTAISENFKALGRQPLPIPIRRVQRQSEAAVGADEHRVLHVRHFAAAHLAQRVFQ